MDRGRKPCTDPAVLAERAEKRRQYINAYMREYYRQHREEILEKAHNDAAKRRVRTKAWRQKLKQDPEKYAAYLARCRRTRRAYRQAHLMEVRGAHVDYYWANHEEMLAKQRERYQRMKADPERYARYLEYQREYYVRRKARKNGD